MNTHYFTHNWILIYIMINTEKTFENPHVKVMALARILGMWLQHTSFIDENPC